MALPIAGQDIEISVECLFDKAEDAVRASIVGVRNGVFELSCPAALKPDQQLTLRHPDRLIESRVLYCRPQARGGYLAGVVAASDFERRSEVRMPVDLPATLRICGSPTRIAARVVDISASGMGLEMPHAVALGASVQVELSMGTSTGEIRHCNKRADTYRAGMRITEFALAPAPLVFEARFQNAGEHAVATFTRSIQERQFRYEAILYSLANG